MVFIVLGLLGLAFGSFVTALTWRLHEKKNFVSDRSQCEHCGHVLGPLDLVPVISWVVLRGRCRYCHVAIGWENPLIELSVAALFIASYIFWPAVLYSWQSWASFGLWLVYMVLLVALVVYDNKWMLLPDSLVWPLVVLGLVDAGLRVSMQPHASVLVYGEHVVLGAVALAGFYLALYTVSRGRWVGFGDVKLGLFMGIVLGWQQALLTLFLANLVGLIIVLPGMLSGRLTPRSRVPFGPFLIAGFVLSGLFGTQLIAAYIKFLLNGSL